MAYRGIHAWNAGVGGGASRCCKIKAQNLLGSVPYTLFYKRTWGEDEIQYLNTSFMEYILLSASKEKY